MAINTRVAYALLKLSSNSRIRIDFRSISTGDINYSSVSIVFLNTIQHLRYS